MTTDPDLEKAQPQKAKRPWNVIWLALLVLLIGGLHLLRLALSLAQWEFLSRLLPFSPFYLSLSGAAWGATSLVLAWGLWSGRPWAPFFARITALIFAVYYWIDRLLLAEPNARPANWPFVVLVTAVLLGWTFWILARPSTVAFFGGSHDR